jgi:hypothetical protein
MNRLVTTQDILIMLGPMMALFVAFSLAALVVDHYERKKWRRGVDNH